MKPKILVFVRNEFLKKNILKAIVHKEIDFVEAATKEDSLLKFEILGAKILVMIVEIIEEEVDNQYEFLKEIRKEKDLKIIALIPKDTKIYVGRAIESGVDDVLLIPKEKKDFFDIIIKKLESYLDIINAKQNENIIIKFTTELKSNDIVVHEAKRAIRGKYSVSFVMVQFIGIENINKQQYFQSLLEKLRDTDKIIEYAGELFLLICPFTQKEYILEVEKKIRNTFEDMFGRFTQAKRLDLFGLSFPNSGDSLETIIDKLKDGVQQSAIIRNINTPFNELSKNQVENYKRMIKKYDRFNF